MIDGEDDKDLSHYLVFKCISHLFSSYFQQVRRQISPSQNIFLSSTGSPGSSALKLVSPHLCLFQVMTILVMVVTSMLIMEIKMIMTMMMMMTVMRNTSGNDCFPSLCQIIMNYKISKCCVGSNIFFPRIVL